jgi:hypothetical protein
MKPIVPIGHVPLEEAINRAARHWFDDKPVGQALSPDELAEAWERLIPQLFADKLQVVLITSKGYQEEVPAHFWGSQQGRSIYTPHKLPPLPVIISIRVALDNYPYNEFVTVSGTPSVDATMLADLLQGDELSRADLAASNQPQRRAARTIGRDVGGRPPNYDWDRIWVEIVRVVHEEGLPARKSQLVEKIQQWCEDEYGRQPSESTLKPKIALLWEVLRPSQG